MVLKLVLQSSKLVLLGGAGRFSISHRHLQGNNNDIKKFPW